jgi:hypothetical protein
MWKKLLAYFRGKNSAPGSRTPESGGGPKPTALAAPIDLYMPEVDEDQKRDEEAFATARQMSAGAFPSSEYELNQRCVAIITPGRLIMPISGPPAAAVSTDMLSGIPQVIPSQPRLAITVIAFNDVVEQDALTAGQVNALIPFLGYLVAMAFHGHTVVVFEGHRSAFEAGIRNSDMLIIDSAMLPFLQKDWMTVACRAMRQGARMFIHDRKDYSLRPVARAKNQSGWQYTEPDGEASYVNCLLTTMAKAPKRSVRITAGTPLPDLAQIATDAAELDWISALPFKYAQPDAEQIIETLVRLAGVTKPDLPGNFPRSLTLKARLATASSELRDVSFELTESRTNDGGRQLEIELSC